MAGDFWGAKVTLYKKYRQLEFQVVVKAEDGAVVNYKVNIIVVEGAQTVTFGHQGRSYILKSNEVIEDEAVLEKIKAELGDVTFVKKRGIDERWKNAEIIDVDAVDDDVTQPAKKKIKREFITELFKELRF